MGLGELALFMFFLLQIQYANVCFTVTMLIYWYVWWVISVVDTRMPQSLVEVCMVGILCGGY